METRTRREAIKMTGGFVCALSYPSVSHGALPLFFAAGLSALAGTVVRSTLTSLLRRAAVRSVSKKFMSRSLAAPRSTMARSKWRFTEPVAEFGGAFATIAAFETLRGNQDDVTVAAAGQKSPKFGGHCVAITSDVKGSKTAFLENAEIVALGQGINQLRRAGVEESEITSTLIPIHQQRSGQFNYENGHVEPRVCLTANGTIYFDSKIGRNGSPRCEMNFVGSRGDIGEVEAIYDT